MTSSSALLSDGALLRDEELWKQAYLKLDKHLKRQYEQALQREPELSKDLKLEAQADALVELRKNRVSKRQWTYPWKGRSKKVRTQVDGILNVVEKTAGVVSIGLQFAPPYISLPWAAITSILPLLTNDTKQHDLSLDGIEKITTIVSRFKVVQKVYFDDRYPSYSDLQDSIVALYAKVFEYQASLAAYLGMNTLKRFGSNVLELGNWSGLNAQLEECEKQCRKQMRLYDSWTGQMGTDSILAKLDDQKATVKELLARQKQEQSSRLLSWISEHDAYDDHNRILTNLGRQYTTSGEWLFEKDNFRSWKASRSDVFTLRGGIGTGKSCLTALVVEHLLQCSGTTTAFFYCRREDSSSSRSPSEMLLSILHCVLRQLCQELPINQANAVLDELVERREQRLESRLRFSEDQLQSAFSTLIQQWGSLALVIDALDECICSDQLMRFLQGLLENKLPLKIFLSGRQHIRFGDVFSNPVKQNIEEGTKLDISTYVEYEIFHSGRRGPKKVPTDQQAKDLQQYLTDHASGMFRWLELQLDLFLPLNDQRPVGDLKSEFQTRLNRLRNMPSTFGNNARAKLSAAYGEMYAMNLGISADQMKQPVTSKDQLLREVFFWLLWSLRPLHLQELVQALKVAETLRSLASEVNEELLLGLGSNFYQADAENVVRFVHLSAREFLCQPNCTGGCGGRMCLKSTEAHAKATRLCLDRIWQLTLDTGNDFVALEYSGTYSDKSTTFDSYSSTYWCHHARASRDLFTANKQQESYSKLKSDMQSYMVRHLARHFPIWSSTWVSWNLTYIDLNICLRIALFIWDYSPARLLHPELRRFWEMHLVVLRGLLPSVYNRLVAQSTSRSGLLTLILQHLLANYALFPRYPPYDILHIGVQQRNVPLVETLLHEDLILLKGGHASTFVQSGMTELVRSALDLTTPSGREIRDASAYEDLLRTALHYQQYASADLLWNACLEESDLEPTRATASAYFSTLGSPRTDRQTSLQRRTVSAESLHATLCMSCKQLLTSGAPKYSAVAMSTIRNQSRSCMICQYLDKIGGEGSENQPRLSDAVYGVAEAEPYSDSTVEPSRSPRRTTVYASMILREAIEKRTFFLVAAISFIVGALAYEPPKSSLVRISSYCGIAVCVFAIVSEGLGRGYGSGWLLYQNRFGESLRRSGTSEQQLAHVEIIGPKKLSPRVLPLQICHSQECTDTTQHREIPVYKLWSNEHSGLPLFISALKVNDDIFSRDSNRMISAWHGDCVEYHAGCSKELPDQMPTRLIDIEQMCVVTEVGTAPYVFLSWNWSQDASSMLTTTSKLPQYENSGIKAFPAAIAGAIRLARELGYSYVWADLYCVVHDDLEDKNIELSKITSYVEQATLTIGVTLGAFDKRINTSKTSEPIPYALAVKSGRGSFQDINGNIFVSTPLPDATSSLLSSQWASRGWTLQERYYSSRTLVIGEDRLYWNCNTLLRSETSLEAHPPLWRLRRCGDVKSFSSGIADRSVWYSLVEYHSATSITTYVRDKLASVSALAGSLAGGDTYCMGHWSNDAPTGLLWRTWTDQKRDSEWLGMPSWSWGSAAGPVTFIAVRCSRVPTLNDASIEFCGAGPAIPHSYDPSREDLTMRLRARTRSLLLSDHPNVRFDAADTPRPKNGNVVLQNSLLIVYLAKYRSKTRNVQRWYGLALRKVSFEALDKEEQNTLQSPNCAPTPEYYKRIGLYLGPAEQITATPDEQKMSNSGVWGEWQDLLVI